MAPKMGPKILQNGEATLPENLDAGFLEPLVVKEVPRWLKMPQICPKMAPRWPKMGQDGPRWAKIAPRWVVRGS